MTSDTFGEKVILLRGDGIYLRGKEERQGPSVRMIKVVVYKNTYNQIVFRDERDSLS